MIKYTDPDYAAVSLRRELGMDDSKAADFIQVLPALNIRMREDHLVDGTLGACKVIGSHRLIVISTAIKYETQKRFTISHEVGHIVLHHGTSYCNSEDLLGFRISSDKEREANQFASAFLLPQVAVLKVLKLNDISFAMAESLAEQYDLSLTSTLIRLVKSSSDNVCLFVHSGGKIEFPVMSQGCRLRPKRGIIDPKTLANRLTDKDTILCGNSDCSYWFDDDIPFEEYNCIEESRFFRQLQKCITIINISSDDM